MPSLWLHFKFMELEDFKSGQVILIDKPLEWTSFQVVNKIRWAISKKFRIKKIKVGHAGTLDPLASGLLILCTGKFTKRIEEFQAQEKTYTGKIKLGATTPSYDLETEIDQTFATEHINDDLLQKKTKLFIGEIDQFPPVFSAIKKQGKRLYDLARKGKEIDVESRKIQIHSFKTTLLNDDLVEFEVVCSKGTYIRSLAHDLGRALDSGGHLVELRRTKIGDYSVEDALSIEKFVEKLRSE